MKKKVVILVSVGLTLATLYAIWRFSAQDSSETTALSGGLAREIWSWLEKVVEKMGGELSLLGVEAVLRKMAHFGVFLVLGIGLTGIFVWQKRVPVWLIVLIIGMICAAIDELHQSFVPGRNPSWFDVAIDTFGVWTGMVMILLATRRIRHKVELKNGDED